jgi:acetolactate synthase-1/2/3 large subunit
MRVYESIADQIGASGVAPVFTFMSEETAKLTAELVRRGVRVYHARHEHVAVGMADGYSRATGKLALAIVGQGPGLTNALNALVTAANAQSNVLVLAGETDTHIRDSGSPARLINKYVNQPALLDAVGIDHIDLTDATTARDDVRASIELARAERRTLLVNMPSSILEAEGHDGKSLIRIPSALRFARGHLGVPPPCDPGWSRRRKGRSRSRATQTR